MLSINSNKKSWKNCDLNVIKTGESVVHSYKTFNWNFINTVVTLDRQKQTHTHTYNGSTKGPLFICAFFVNIREKFGWNSSNKTHKKQAKRKHRMAIGAANALGANWYHVCIYETVYMLLLLCHFISRFSDSCVPKRSIANQLIVACSLQSFCR